ncbi:MAG: PD40 domain-containing protein [Bacteroidales bacterium]|nr:PD40 domain-containing protein [Bacteroidales bacterium]
MHARALFFLLAGFLAGLSGCTPGTFTDNPGYPPIFPDYIGVTVPEGMAPLTFRMEDGRKFRFEQRREDDVLWTTVFAWKRGDRQGVRYAPFPIYFSNDPIDPYIAYRLIEPGYESWRNMGIYQRELASYAETPIVTNRADNTGCVNCHTFADRSPDRMLFHVRGQGGGTVFLDGDKARIRNLSQTGPRRQGTYPAWHPDGRYVVFSSNATQQCFTIRNEQPVEVYDTDSDLIIYDTAADSVQMLVSTANTLETFPAWSPDGGTLYWCEAKNPGGIPRTRGEVRYRLMAATFADGTLTDEPRVIFGHDSLSVSFPRVNGKWLLFTAARFGTFPIWHKEADLMLLNLETGEVQPAGAINSDETDSYHAWSGGGHWVIFSSRRLDGRYTRLFLSHFDQEGHFSKPFLLPQENPDHNILRLKSYNIPEFVTGPVPDRQDQIAGLFSKEDAQ